MDNGSLQKNNTALLYSAFGCKIYEINVPIIFPKVLVSLLTSEHINI